MTGLPPRDPLPSNGKLPPQTHSPALSSSSGHSLHYQGKVSGLQGWNDAPSAPFARKLDSSGSQSKVNGTDEPLDADRVANLLRSVLSTVQSSIDPSQKRVLEDTEKRLTVLFERLEKKSLPEAVFEKLGELSQALEKKDFATATSIHLFLLTGHFEDEGRWLVGIKRLIEMYQKGEKGNDA